MGRDFTPKQIHYINTKIHPGLYMSNVTWTTSKGESSSMYTDEEMEIRRKYPVFATTFSDRFIEFYNWTKMYGYTERIDQIERILNDLTKQEEKDDVSSFPEKLVKWYRGELDPHYHYHEDNDSLFYEWLITWISGTEFPAFSQEG